MSTTEHVTVVKSPRVIDKMIARHYEQRGSFTLLPEDDVDYQGVALMVGNDPDQRQFLIEQPSPVVARHLLAAKRVKFQGVIDQLLVWFYISDLAEVVEGEDRYFAIRYPQHIERLQRRGAYRVALPVDVSGILAFRAESESQARSAQVYDVSTGGCAIDLSVDDAKALPVGSVVEAARICVIDHFDLKVKFEVCNIRPVSEKRVLVGVRFVEMPALDEQQIDRAIMHLQRQLMHDG